MKRLTIGLLLGALILSGYAYTKQTLLNIKGDEVKVPLGLVDGISGKNLRGTLYRQTSISFPAKDTLKDFKNVKTTDTTTADDSTGTIDITQ